VSSFAFISFQSLFKKLIIIKQYVAFKGYLLQVCLKAADQVTQAKPSQVKPS